jgi:hypothetical protein
MPETLGGLALFAALLVPGFVYLERRESRQAGQQLSPLRETGQILFASLVCDAAVLGLLALFRALAPGLTPDVGAFVRGGGVFGRTHHRDLLAWGVPALGAACVLAAMVAVPPKFVGALAAALRSTESPLRQEIDRRQRPRIVAESGWSAAFLAHPDRVPCLGVTLQDDTYLFGRLFSWNPEIEETADRSLVLAGPVVIRSPGASATEALDADTVVISADQIRLVTVSYLPDVLAAIPLRVGSIGTESFPGQPAS